MCTGSKSRGYTIVEVMIFLAISGLMFVIAANFVSGKQGKAELRQGVSDINSQIQQVINNVNNGFYPSGSGLNCSASTSGLTIGTGGNPQGANEGCVMLGMVMQFGVNNNSAQFATYDVAGSQFAGGAAPTTDNPLPQTPTDFSSAFPTAVDYSGVSPQIQTLEWGLQVTKMFDNGSPIGAVGFMSTGAAQSAGSLVSGSQSSEVVSIGGSSLGQSESSMVGTINAALSGATGQGNVRPKPNILICFDGGKGQFGSITIGGSNYNQKLSTSMQINDGSPPAGC